MILTGVYTMTTDIVLPLTMGCICFGDLVTFIFQERCYAYIMDDIV